MKDKKKHVHKAMGLALLLLVLVAGVFLPVQEASAAVINYNIQDYFFYTVASDSPTTSLYVHQNVILRLQGLIPQQGSDPNARLVAGDTFSIPIPDDFIIPTSLTARTIEFYKAGVHYATGILNTTSPIRAGGTLDVTLNSDAEQYNTVDFNVALTMNWNRTKHNIPSNQQRNVAINIRGITKNITLMGQPPQQYGNEILNKWVNTGLSPEGYVKYNLRINGEGKPKTNVVVTDQLGSIPGNNLPADGIYYIADQFVLSRGTLNTATGDYTAGETVALTAANFTLAPDNRSFELRLGNISDTDTYKTYFLEYRTNFINGIFIRNHAYLTADNVPERVYRSQDFRQVYGGDAFGDLINKITVIKKASDTEESLAGVKFHVTKVNNSNQPIEAPVEYTTNSSGFFVTPTVSYGDRYKIEEISFPAGYEVVNPAPSVVIAWTNQHGTWGKTNIRTITNKPVMVTPRITKVWEPAGLVNKPPAYFELLADGVVIDQVTLSAANPSHSFGEHRKYRKDKLPVLEEVVYTIREVNTAPNFQFTMTGDLETGFTATNKYVSPTRPVTGTIEWIGSPPYGYTQPTVYFKLLVKDADGNVTVHPTAPLLPLPRGTNSVTWPSMPISDENGRPLEYFVEVTDNNGDHPPIANIHRLDSIEGSGNSLHVKMRWAPLYTSPRITVTGTVTWVGTPPPGEGIETVHLKLMRKDPRTGNEEDAHSIPVQAVHPGMTSVSWNVPKTNLFEEDYEYFVYFVDQYGNRIFKKPYAIGGSGFGLHITLVWDWDPPKTGDNTPLGLLLFLLSASVVGFAVFWKKRKFN